MKYLGNTKERISEIGIGTWKMGIDPESERQAIETAIKCGMNLIDTAEMYGTEWIVSKAVKVRRKAFIATKASPNHFSYNDLISACNRSLSNLRLKYIDLYQLHWPNHSVPIRETMRAMEDLADAGKIRYIGVSNFSVKEFEEARSCMDRHDIVSNQVEYSILVREAEKNMLDYCNSNNVTLMAYSPFARGALFDPSHVAVLDGLAKAGKAHRKTASQVALNWLVSNKCVVAIPKAAGKDHVMENKGASGWSLTRREKARLDSISERRQSLAGILHPVLKSNGAWAGAAHSIYAKKGMAHLNRRTARSSKK